MSYADWGRIDSDEEDDLEDNTFYTGTRDVILFCIDCSQSMFEAHEDPMYEEMKTCNLLGALEAAVQIQKKKVVVGPRDCVGVLLFNTSRRPDADAPKTASELKQNTYLYQAIGAINAPDIQKTMRIIDATREQGIEYLKSQFPPVEDSKRVTMGDVFTTANWVFRDGAPKTATKRVFLITDSDDPHAPLLRHARETDPSAARKKEKVLFKSAKTTLVDLSAAGITVEPFFISTEDQPFDVQRFYSSVLLRGIYPEDDEDEDSSILNPSYSIARIEDLLAQMRFREVPKRAMFNLDFTLASLEKGKGKETDFYDDDVKDFKIGVKGYSLVTEQKKGTYKYFVDMGDRLENAVSTTSYIDEVTEHEYPRNRFVYGVEGGGIGQPGVPDPQTANSQDDDALDSDDGGEPLGFGARVIKPGDRPFYSAEEVQSFRTLGELTGIKLLGFKDASELVFEDNTKHSTFLYPDEAKYSGSRRTFLALLRTMVSKQKVGFVRALVRRNSTPVFYALLPREENEDTGDPAGFHLIPLPFADDLREAPITEGKRAPKPLVKAAQAMIKKLTLKNGGYPHDSYPNPALAYHNAQVEAVAFQEEFDPGAFEDLTEPKYDMMRKRAGPLIEEWKNTWDHEVEEGAPASAGAKKRKAGETVDTASGEVDDAEIKNRYENGTLTKMTIPELKEFLKAKSQPLSGKKADLVDRVVAWLDTH